MAFGNSFSQPNTQPPSGTPGAGQSASANSGNPPMQAATMSAPQGASQPAQAAAAETPGFGLVDGVMSLVLAPGRAIIGTINQPTMRDLPLVIGISAAFWWAAWWAFNKYYLNADSGNNIPFVKKRKRIIKTEPAEYESDED